MPLRRRNASAVAGKPLLVISASVSTRLRISARNQGSILQEAWMSWSENPSRMAWATLRRRSGVGVPSAARTAFLSSP